jgi:hypothetical protein
MELDIEKTFG